MARKGVAARTITYVAEMQHDAPPYSGPRRRWPTVGVCRASGAHGASAQNPRGQNRELRAERQWACETQGHAPNCHLRFGLTCPSCGPAAPHQITPSVDRPSVADPQRFSTPGTGAKPKSHGRARRLAGGGRRRGVPVAPSHSRHTKPMLGLLHSLIQSASLWFSHGCGGARAA